MNALLMKNRPKDMSKEEWEKLSANSHVQLEPLANTIRELMDQGAGVRPDDFDCPNHYAKLVADLARRKTLGDILAMLPSQSE
jgi:GTPase Era involved in 16S rRNA processing